MSDREAPRVLVLDTSVAVKFYLAEDLMEEARRLRTAVAGEAAELVAPAHSSTTHCSSPSPKR